MDNKVRRDIEKKKEQYRKNVQVAVKAMEENDILEKRIQRLENLDEYYKRGERAKRAHRLITKGAAIEHILPESKEMEDADFYQLMKKILTTNKPNPADPIDVLARVGGFELGAIAGLILGAATSHSITILE